MLLQNERLNQDRRKHDIQERKNPTREKSEENSQDVGVQQAQRATFPYRSGNLRGLQETYHLEKQETNCFAHIERDFYLSWRAWDELVINT